MTLRFLQCDDADFRVTAYHAKHLEVYRVLIDLAPTVRKKNPRIVELLTRRMEVLVENAEQYRITQNSK